ncbi:MAG: nitronate monooxygenase [Methylocystaceae bacterium]|nr:nitronate monooxygenase [Methylocystaceae bacterium]
MSIPKQFNGRLKLPAVAAPMFLVSGPDLVIETCKSGVVGTFPALNQRTSEGFEEWVVEIKSKLAAYEKETGAKAAPFGVNLIAHRSNKRLDADLAICVKHEVPLIITSLGAVPTLIDQVHAYGGIVFHDVINVKFAKKAADAGADGLICVCAGAGGHAGQINPFALISEIRQFYDKTVLLAGTLSTGQDIASAQMIGADLAYLGTRFIATQEAMAVPEYKEMIIESHAADIVYTPKISGVNANFLMPSIEKAGIDLSKTPEKTEIDFGSELKLDKDSKAQGAWSNIWSAGQGVGSIQSSPSVSHLIQTLHQEYCQAIATHQEKSKQFL